MKKTILLLLIIICALLTTGCSEEGQKSSVEELALVSSIGFDLTDEKEMRITVGIPQPVGESPVLTEVYSVNSDMIQEGLVDISSQADKKVILNQLRTILFSEEFARSGKMTKVIEHLYRDDTLGNKVHLTIVKDQSEDILKGDYPENQHMDAYLNDIFDPSLHNSFSPFTTIHDYMNSQTDAVYHTVVPYLEKKEDSLKVTKVALFNDEKMIDTISKEESLLIEAMNGLDKLAPIAIKFENNEVDKQLFLEQIQSKKKIKTNNDIESAKVSIKLKIKAVLVEYKGDRNLNKVEGYNKLEKEINKHLEKEIKVLLEKLQELEVDPVGLSENFRMYHQGKWTEELTQKVIATSKYDVTVDFIILNTGTLQ